MQRVLLIILGILTVATGAFAYKLHLDLVALANRGETSEELAAAAQLAETDRLRDALKLSEENVARLKRERDEARAKAAASEMAAVAATGDPTKPAGESATKEANPVAGFAKMFQSEEGKKMMATQVAMVTRKQYADLARLLKLDPALSEQVMTLLGERAADLAKDSFKMMEGPMDEAAIQEMGRTSEALRADYDMKLKSVLGAEKFAALKEYDGMLGERQMLTQVEEQMADAPLQTTQHDALLKIMSDERKKTNSIFDPSGRDVVRNYTAMQEDGALDRWSEQEADYQRRVLAAAPTALSPDQVNALQKAMAQTFEMQKFGMKMGKEMMKGAKK